MLRQLLQILRHFGSLPKSHTEAEAKQAIHRYVCVISLRRTAQIGCKMSKYLKATEDIVTGLKRYRVWHVMSMEDLRLRYRRTAFGVLWLTATFGLFIAAKTFVFGGLMAVPFNEYTLYMATSFLIWGFLNTVMIDACTTWVNAESWLRGVNVPKSIFVYQVIWRNLVTCGYSAIAVIVIYILLRHMPSWSALMAIPALLLLVINAVWVCLFFGIAATRYRDILHLMRTFMGIMFFVTPILWIPRTMGPKFELFALYNPFAHFLAIVRDPLVYGTSSPLSWAVCIGTAIIGWLAAFLLFARYRNRLVFWF